MKTLTLKHTEKISNQCSKTIGILNRLKHVLPLDITVLLYNTLPFSHINYCIIIWGYRRNRITSIKTKVMRMSTLNTYNLHTEPLFPKNILTTESRRYIKVIRINILFYIYS